MNAKELRARDTMLSRERKKKREDVKAQKRGSKKRKIAKQESEDNSNHSLHCQTIRDVLLRS
jgi:hypothetical protein